VIGSNDIAYSLGMVNHSYRVHGGRPALSIGVRYGHSHKHGWKRKESMAFADSICSKAGPMVRITKQGQKNDTAFVAFDKRTTPKRAVLCYTNDEVRWRDRFWRTGKATIRADVASAIVPPTAKACFFNLIDAKGLIISTPLL
jgi:plasmid replication initiation protein